jgi:hypothetical protein
MSTRHRRCAALLVLVAATAGCVRADWRSRASTADAALADAIGEGTALEVSLSCGNGKLEQPEECDGAELQGNTCVSLGRGFTGGTLRCKSCRYDISACFSSAPGHATLLYGSAEAVVVSQLDTKTGGWTTSATVPLEAPRWVVNRISPVDPQDEVAAASALAGTTQSLVLLRKGWSVDQTLPLAVPSADADKRVFDLAYERKSGEALLVYSDNTSNPTYMTRATGGTWSEAKKIFSGTPPGTEAVRWVLLVGSPRSDEISLLYSDASNRVFLVVWNGSAFLETEYRKLNFGDVPGVGYPSLSFGAAYEDQSGNLLATEGDPCCSCLGFEYRVGPSWQTSDVGVACAYQWATVKLSPLRGSNAVAIAGVDANVAVWTGSGWYQAAMLWPVPEPPPHNPGGDVAWVGSQPVAIAVHRGESTFATGTGYLNWVRSSTGGVWQRGAPLAVAGLGVLSWVQLAAFPVEDRVLAAFSDGSSLWVATYELGGGWALGNGGKPLADKALAIASTRPFSFDITQ